ncbi:hypothetical protein BKA70DRAFT_1439927 [Coprinopsis sp. MPI-PUGE-AT-0042]|nr:hypothetical protein BKA70DRAFT_1439927 [Coprinopsis sp. MPI-PUGE-AT-0042]
MKFLSAFVPVALALASMASPVTSDPNCTTVESFIGENKDIKVETVICEDGTSPNVPRSLEARQDVTDLCFVGCSAECLGEPAPGQPTPVVFDCEQIAEALRFEAHQVGTTGPFSVAAGASSTITNGQCKTTFTNKRASGSVGWCQEGWAATLFGLTNSCGSKGIGGVCSDRAAANRWDVRYQRP